MYKIILTIFMTITLTFQSTHAQWVRDFKLDGPPSKTVIEECKDAKHCIRKAEENLVSKDYQKAIIYMETAANMGSAEAQYRLAELIENNIYRDIARQILGDPIPYASHPPSDEYLIDAYFWYKISDLNNHGPAKNILVPMWDKIKTSSSVRRRGRNEEETKRLMQIINAEVSAKIGAKYLTGGALPNDYDQALRYFKIGITYDIPIAGVGMAKLYELGKPVARDLVKARELYSKYIEYIEMQSDIDADYYYRYAQMLENGLGGPVDMIGAYTWMFLAATCGFEDAENYIDILEEKLTQPELKEAKNILTEKYYFPCKPFIF